MIAALLYLTVLLTAVFLSRPTAPRSKAQTDFSLSDFKDRVKKSDNIFRKHFRASVPNSKIKESGKVLPFKPRKELK